MSMLYDDVDMTVTRMRALCARLRGMTIPANAEPWKTLNQACYELASTIAYATEPAKTKQEEKDHGTEIQQR